MKLYCNVEDLGSSYAVRDAFSLTTTHINFVTGKQVLEIDSIATYNAIVKLLSENKLVRIPKNVFPLNPGDLIVMNGLDELSAEKNVAFSHISNVVNRRISSLFNMYFFEFTILNNRLTSKGYSITEENKEEKYLEILETADESLISLLQSFLEVQAKIAEYQNLFDQFKKTMVDIDETAEISEVIFIKNQFLATFN